MKTFKYLFFLLLIITIGFCTYIAVQPNNFEVTRIQTINAPAAVVYNNVIDFKNWQSWSSWSESNSYLKISLSEQTKGINGASFWENEDGVGTLTTTEANAYDSIKQHLEMTDFPSSDVTWSFQTNEDGSTKVTSSFSANNLSFGFKINAVLYGTMEKKLGPHFERSLQKLDSIVVTDMKKYHIDINGFTQHSGGYYIYNTASCKIDNLKENINKMMPIIKNYAAENNIAIDGFPFVNYHKFDEENNAVMFSCCLPTTSRVITTENDILTGKLDPFTTLKTTLTGNHSYLFETWEMAMEYIKSSNNETDENGPMLETFVTDESNSPNPADWKTEIYIAIKN